MSSESNSRDRGSGSLWVLFSVAVALAATLVVLGWAAAIVARQRAESAADLAALAGARAAYLGRDACAAGGRVAAAMGAHLSSCRVGPDGTVQLVADVRLPGPLLRALDLPPARARARAGLPVPSPSSPRDLAW